MQRTKFTKPNLFNQTYKTKSNQPILPKPNLRKSLIDYILFRNKTSVVKVSEQQARPTTTTNNANQIITTTIPTTNLGRETIKSTTDSNIVPPAPENLPEDKEYERNFLMLRVCPLILIPLQYYLVQTYFCFCNFCYFVFL